MHLCHVLKTELKRDITLIVAQGVAGDTKTNANEDPMKYICTVMLAAAHLCILDMYIQIKAFDRMIISGTLLNQSIVIF